MFGLPIKHGDSSKIMGITRAANFTIRQNDLSKGMKALAHPARIGIIEHLLKSNECICSDLVEVLGLAQATFPSTCMN